MRADASIGGDGHGRARSPRIQGHQHCHSQRSDSSGASHPSNDVSTERTSRSPMSRSDRGSKACHAGRCLADLQAPDRVSATPSGHVRARHAGRDRVLHQHGELHGVRQSVRRRYVRESRSAHHRLVAAGADRVVPVTRPRRLHPDLLHGLCRPADREASARPGLRAHRASAGGLFRSQLEQRVADQASRTTPSRSARPPPIRC